MKRVKFYIAKLVGDRLFIAKENRMNNDLISREALKEALHNEIGDHALSTAIDRVIDNAPTVSPEKALINKLKGGNK